MAEGMGFDPTVKIDRWGEHRLALAVLVVAGIVGVAFAGDGYLIRLLTLGCIYSTLALGLRMTFGELGELDLGYLALYAMGGYTYALARIHWHVGELPATAVAVLAVALLALLVSRLTLRLTGPYFAVTTLGVLVVMTSFIASTDDLTGGVMGLHGFGGGAGTAVPYTDASGRLPWFLVAFGLLVVVAAVTYWVRASRFGDAVNAIRQDPVLFQSLGYNVTLFRTLAATIGGAIAGLAGSAIAMYSGFVSVNMLSMANLGLLLVIVKLGGARSPAGVILAGFVVTLVPEYLRFVGDYRLLAFGVVLLLAVRLFSAGVGPGLGDLVARFDRRNERNERRERAAAADAERTIDAVTSEPARQGT
jgi:branched-chain amino acid transport system permease protein